MYPTAENLKRPVWIASGASVSGVRQFDEPVLFNWNWRSLSSNVDMMAFGPDYMDYRKAVVSNDELDNIKRLDKVWMDVTPSDSSDTLASDADFYIASVDKGAGGYGTVVFKRLSPDA